MNIKWLGQKSHLDTNSLQVEWLGIEHVKQRVATRWNLEAGDIHRTHVLKAQQASGT
jgi:hypothetical protein